MNDSGTLRYFRWIFLTALLPYAAALLSEQGKALLEFGLSGIAWLTILIVSLYYISRRPKDIVFPAWAWLPWLSYIWVHWVFDLSFLGLQSTLQYSTTVCVGMAGSTLRYSDATLLKLRNWFMWFVAAIVINNTLHRLGFGFYAVGASGVMTLSIAVALFLSDFWIFRNWKSLVLSCAIALIPLLYVTRMGILVIFAIFAFHFANRHRAVKVLTGIIMAFFLAAVFYSEGFQRKSFYSGSGSIEQAVELGENLNTNGRMHLWMLAEHHLDGHEWLGMGARSDLRLLLRYHYKLKELHNDYISVRYNYGWTGLALLIFAFITLFIILVRKGRYVTDAFTAVFYYAALTLFIAWVGFMFSDNALKYAVFFGNFHFAVMGIVFSRLNRPPVKTVLP